MYNYGTNAQEVMQTPSKHGGAHDLGPKIADDCPQCRYERIELEAYTRAVEQE
jgi:hypothetical protein